jgi:hypothetical protein
MPTKLLIVQNRLISKNLYNELLRSYHLLLYNMPAKDLKSLSLY